MTDLEAWLPKIWVPHDYQNRGVEWLMTHPEGALFFAPGMGKTSVTLMALQRLKELGYPARCLVLAPLRVAQATWRAEAIKWRQFCELKIGLAHGPDKAAILTDKSYDVVLLNYDGLVWASKHLIKGHTFQVLVCDELTKLKRTSTQRFKAIRPTLPSFQFRWGLTGTPAANGLLDLFGQMLILDFGYRLGKYITHYRLNYFYQKPHDQYTWHVSPQGAARIHAKIADLAMYIKPEEVLKLPPISHIQIQITLPADVQKQYKQLEDIAILELQSAVLTAANAGVLTSKLRQFTSGAVYTNAEHDVEVVHTAKLEALDDLVEELAGEPLLLTYNFTHELDRILELYPNALVIRGGMTSKQLELVLTAWNSGEAPLLCAQADAVAHGLNLQTGGSALCWFSQTYNLEVYTQLIARLYRQGQSNHVRVYHIVAEKTIDTKIQKVLSTKDITQEALFTALREELLK